MSMKTPLRCIGLALVLSIISGCAGRNVEDPALFRSAREAAVQFSEIWAPGLLGYTASIRPNNKAFGEHNLVLQAIYKAEEPGRAQFALFLPQGSKVGQCERSGRKTVCSAASVPGAEALARSAFAALDEIFLLAPKDEDEWDLRQGDGPARLPMARTLLRRRTATEEGTAVVLYEPSGKLVAAYKHNRAVMDKPALAWKADFSENPARYSFKNTEDGSTLDVLITRFRMP